MNDGYCTTSEVLTICRFFAASQQADCKGFQRGRREKCVWWLNRGGELYHCTNPDAQAAAMDEIKNGYKKEGEP